MHRSKLVAVCTLLLLLTLTLSLTASAKDTLVVAHGIEVPTFDPQRVTGIDAITAIAHMYDRLVYMDIDGSIHPWLATHWEVSEDERTWTFYMRDDAIFHDGTPVTADAVKFSIERAIGPESPPSLGRTYLQMIDDVEVVDPHTVRITTAAPFGPFLRHMGHLTVASVLNPAAVAAADNDLSMTVVGSGMYRLVEWRRNEHLILERNEDWWGPKPYFQQIIYKPIPDLSTRIIMLERGEVDVIAGIPAFEVDRLAANSNIDIVETTSIRSMFFAFNVERAPLDDARVRQALNYAIDRDAIIQAILSGNGEPAQSVLSPALDFWVPTLDTRYEPEKARQLLEEAGVAPGTTLVLESPQGRWPLDSETALIVAGYLEEVGFNVDVRLYGDWASYQGSRRDGNFHLTMSAWAPGSLDADGTFSNILRSGAANNYGRYANPKMDELIVAGASSVDPEVRAEAYGKLQEFYAEEVPNLLIYHSMAFTGIRSNIQGVRVRGDEALIFFEAEAR